MRKILLIIILAIAVGVIAGCGNMTYEERVRWSQALRESNQALQQNELRNSQSQTPLIQQNNSTYWQERYYQNKMTEITP